MQRFKSQRHAQRFLFSHSMICSHFPPRCHLMTTSRSRAKRTKAFPDLATKGMLSNNSTTLSILEASGMYGLSVFKLPIPTGRLLSRPDQTMSCGA